MSLIEDIVVNALTDVMEAANEQEQITDQEDPDPRVYNFTVWKKRSFFNFYSKIRCTDCQFTVTVCPYQFGFINSDSSTMQLF